MTGGKRGGARDEEFYVGYQAHAPAGIARFLRGRVAVLVAVAAAIAIVLATSQGRFAQSFFEFGNVRAFEGHVSEFPYPTLLVPRPGTTGGELPFSRYLLVATGKHGAADLTAGLDGRAVRIEGTLIHRDGQTMIEVAETGVRPLSATASPGAPATASAGRHTLAGEIVDSKCYLGVMKPGHTKPHRACAIRCISGGIPPVFVARDEHGSVMHLLMVGEDGRTLNREVLPFVADPLVLDGEIVRDGGLLILRTEPASFRRLVAGGRT